MRPNGVVADLRGKAAVIEVSESGMLALVGGDHEVVELATDEWSIEINGVEVRSGDLTFTHEPDSTYRAVVGEFTYVMQYRRAQVSGRELLVRTLSVHSRGSFAVNRVGFRVVPVAAIDDAVEIRTFSESPFAVAVRLDKLTLLTGVQNPHTVTSFDDGVHIVFDAALVAHTSFQVSDQFFAVVERSGLSLQPVHPKSRVGVGERRPRARFRNPSEALPIDVIEIEALRAVVRDFLSPLPTRNRFILYTYWYPLPHSPANADEEALWIETIDNFVDLGGELLLTVPLTDAVVPDAGADAMWDLEPAGSSAARIMDYARQSGLEVGYYMGVAAGNLPFSNAPGIGLPLDAPDAWRKVRSDGSLALENCLANEDYAQWLYTVSANTISRLGLSAWSWDPGPGDGAHCFATHHGHEPGRGEHAGWLRGQQLVRSLHAAFPGLHLQGYYGQKQDGTWGMAGISQHEGYWEQQGEWGGGLYPELSAERLNGNGVRQQAWWSQNFRYLPAETNHALFGRMSQICVEDAVLGQTFDWWGWRFGLLSAIAIGGAPTAATLPPRDVSEVIRNEYRWWLSWARAHAQQPQYDIAAGAQVELGAADWYLRGDAREAHLFVCNPGGRPTRARIPLREHLPAELVEQGRVVALQASSSGSVSTTAVPEFFDVVVPAFTVLAYTVTSDPGAVEVCPDADASAAGSGVVPVDLWRADNGGSVVVPNPTSTTAHTIHCELAALPRQLSSDPARYQALQARLPHIPDTFAYVDLDRVVLVIPLLDADLAPAIRVLIDGVDAGAEVYRYAHKQMERYSIAQPDVDQWPESNVVWWCDLTPHLGDEPVTLSIELPDLEPFQFLGPYLQVPADLAAAFASTADPAVEYAGQPLEVFPPLRRATSSGPRVTDAWITPDAVPSNSQFSLFVRAYDADAVYASLHVGSGSLSDRRLRPVEGEPGLWVLDAHVYKRAAIILDRSDAVIWATRVDEVSEDFLVAIPWQLDALTR